MLAPKKVKRRKVQKGRMKGMSNRSNFVAYGSYGLKALESGSLAISDYISTGTAISLSLSSSDISCIFFEFSIMLSAYTHYYDIQLKMKD